MGKEYNEQNRLRFYFPGKDNEHQPYKHDKFRYCYTFFKKMGKRGHNDIGDKFDYFLFKADMNINHYSPKFMPELRSNQFGTD